MMPDIPDITFCSHPPRLRRPLGPRPGRRRLAAHSAEASALFRKHGFSPQAAGGWVRGDWLEVRDDGRRYLTERSLRWRAEQEDPE